jgi:hypothetical protein
VDAELESLRPLPARVQDLVLDNIDGPSSLVAELLEGWIDAEAANGVHWGILSALVAVLSHFLELKSELGLFGFGRNADLIEDQANAL